MLVPKKQRNPEVDVSEHAEPIIRFKSGVTPEIRVEASFTVLVWNRVLTSVCMGITISLEREVMYEISEVRSDHLTGYRHIYRPITMCLVVVCTNLVLHMGLPNTS